MSNDYKLITWHFDNDITIYPIADIHLGALGHCKQEWTAFLRFLEGQDNARVIMAGDMINNATRGSIGNVFEDLRPREQKKIMTDQLRPIRDKILCALPGNHEKRSGKDADDDPIYDICSTLNIANAYREDMAVVKMQFGSKAGNGEKNPTYAFGVVHGSGAGSTTGAAVNRAENFGYCWDGIDGLILGHSHKSFETTPAKLVVDKHNNSVKVKPFFTVSCVSWLKYVGYPIAKSLRPSATAESVAQEIVLSANRKHIDIHKAITY